jgi:purine-binding chemotaxis protein CheW
MEEQGLKRVIEKEKVLSSKYMTFIIDATTYALDISQVLDIIRLPNITYFPNQPDYIMGLINLRGKIIPTLDIRLKFKKPFKAYDDRTCILVIEVGETIVGLIVDAIKEVVALNKASFTVPKTVDSIYDNEFIEGISSMNEESIIVLKSQKILEDTV